MKSVNPKTKDIFLKAFELFEQERYEEALRAFKASVQAKPDDANIHYSLALMYLLTGDKNAALNEYRILKSLDADLGKKLIKFISPSGQFKLEV
ncbi:MAG: tetratricopeptide repeat protein [Candidatus Zixiibacteriota bacterium]|nr:MAG: tetratricopeptide repeat protein [candidate division Zixibacteria bacterium]